MAGLAVNGDDHRTVAFETKRHDARKRAIDQPQADPLPGVDLFAARNSAVDRNGVADTTGHRGFHGVAKSGCNLRIRGEPPIREHPDQIAIDRITFRLLDNQWTSEAPAELLQAVAV